MTIEYLGTAAAEGIPALFCNCPTCSGVKTTTKDQRCRSSVLVNGHLLVDLSPDIYLQKLRHGLDLTMIDTLVVTHSHSDHLDAQELTRRSTANYCHLQQEKPLMVYGNEKVCDTIRQALSVEFGNDSDPSISVASIQAGQKISSGELVVVAVSACHDPQEDCLIYLITDDHGKCYLHCNDSGILHSSAVSMIQSMLSGRRLGVVSMDCTFGTCSSSFNGHMGLPENLRLCRLLQEAGCVDSYTQYIATHFSHNCGMNHEGLVQAFTPYGMDVAWDGMIVNF